jgi:hypothetical protein
MKNAINWLRGLPFLGVYECHGGWGEMFKMGMFYLDQAWLSVYGTPKERQFYRNGTAVTRIFRMVMNRLTPPGWKEENE